MAKGDDTVTRKRSKKNRKKQQQKDSMKVSKRTASIIAAKKRRKSGKRRKCQGMCFSLPTSEDPFNDRHGQVDFRITQIKKLRSLKEDPGLCTNRKSSATWKGDTNSYQSELAHVEQKGRMNNNLENEQTASVTSIDNVCQKNIWKLGKTNIQQLGKSGAAHPLHGHAFENPACPSKFLILCLNSIQNTLQHDGSFSGEEDRPLFVDPWGVEFWKCYSIGKDILETSGTCSNTEQIAWMASTAADTITRKEKEGLSFTTPFLLFLVSSKEKAAKVRSVCKPLKALGIHTVSLHPGASLDHQIHGLRSCEPEFLVSTPERLLELISLKAIDISGVSLLVVDGLETFFKGGHLHMVTSIRQSIFGNPQMVVFNDFSSYVALHTVQKLLQGSICRLSSKNCVTSQSSCIIQSVHVCPSEEDKLSMAIEVLDQLCGSQLGQKRSKVLVVVEKRSNVQKLVATIKSKGYFVSVNLTDNNLVAESRKMIAVYVIEAERISPADLNAFEAIVIFDFVSTIENYIQILTNMARFTVNGMLHSIVTREETQLAAPLIKILELCGQAVPEALRPPSHCSLK